MVKSDCTLYKLHFSTTVIRAPHSFNGTCIESHTDLTKRAPARPVTFISELPDKKFSSAAVQGFLPIKSDPGEAVRDILSWIVEKRMIPSFDAEDELRRTSHCECCRRVSRGSVAWRPERFELLRCGLILL
jgi:hypothetical protein